MALTTEEKTWIEAVIKDKAAHVASSPETLTAIKALGKEVRSRPSKWIVTVLMAVVVGMFGLVYDEIKEVRKENREMVVGFSAIYRETLAKVAGLEGRVIATENNLKRDE